MATCTGTGTCCYITLLVTLWPWMLPQQFTNEADTSSSVSLSASIAAPTNLPMPPVIRPSTRY